MGAGLGGGSADGAFALPAEIIFLICFWMNFFLEELLTKLESDCPFFNWKTL